MNNEGENQQQEDRGQLAEVHWEGRYFFGYVKDGHFHVTDHIHDGVSARQLTSESPSYEPIPLSHFESNGHELRYIGEPNRAATLEDAIALAVESHTGQVDKGGAIYILHPLRVMLSVDTEYERMVAVLHDLIEDCGVTPGELMAIGYPDEVLDALLLLTRLPEEGYGDFIERLASNPLARRVKLADMKDNMDLSRIADPDIEDYARVEKYRKWTAYLEEVENSR